MKYRIFSTNAWIMSKDTGGTYIPCFVWVLLSPFNAYTPCTCYTTWKAAVNAMNRIEKERYEKSVSQTPE